MRIQELRIEEYIVIRLRLLKDSSYGYGYAARIVRRNSATYDDERHNRTTKRAALPINVTDILNILEGSRSQHLTYDDIEKEILV